MGTGVVLFMTFHQRRERQCHFEMRFTDIQQQRQHSRTPIKVAIIEGLEEGFLVAESDNVLLICKKDEEHAIRKYVNDAQIKLGDDYI